MALKEAFLVFMVANHLEQYVGHYDYRLRRASYRLAAKTK